jgi:hypothetical protein
VNETVTLTLSADAAAAVSPAAATQTAAPPPATVEPSSTGGGNSALRIASYAAFGVGAVGLGGGTYFWLRYGSKSDDADKLYADYECPNCLGSEKAEVLSVDDEAASAKTLSVVGLVTGGVGIAAGVTLLVLSLNKPAPQAASIVPYASPNEVGVMGRF